MCVARVGVLIGVKLGLPAVALGEQVAVDEHDEEAEADQKEPEEGVGLVEADVEEERRGDKHRECLGDDVELLLLGGHAVRFAVDALENLVLRATRLLKQRCSESARAAVRRGEGVLVFKPRSSECDERRCWRQRVHERRCEAGGVGFQAKLE